jgi:hypothetical protein
MIIRAKFCSETPKRDNLRDRRVDGRIILNKKFWEEPIHLLSLHQSFEVLEPSLTERNLKELALTSFSSI